MFPFDDVNIGKFLRYQTTSKHNNSDTLFEMAEGSLLDKSCSYGDSLIPKFQMDNQTHENKYVLQV